MLNIRVTAKEGMNFDIKDNLLILCRVKSTVIEII